MKQRGGIKLWKRLLTKATKSIIDNIIWLYLLAKFIESIDNPFTFKEDHIFTCDCRCKSVLHPQKMSHQLDVGYVLGFCILNLFVKWAVQNDNVCCNFPIYKC